jgi:hypothetical protein
MRSFNQVFLSTITANIIHAGLIQYELDSQSEIIKLKESWFPTTRTRRLNSGQTKQEKSVAKGMGRGRTRHSSEERGISTKLN